MSRWRDGGSGLVTWAESSPHTSSPWPPWTGSWFAWSCCSSSPWRCGNTHSPPGSPFCLRTGTGWCGGAGRCRAAGPGCTGDCSLAPPWDSDTNARPGRQTQRRTVSNRLEDKKNIPVLGWILILMCQETLGLLFYAYSFMCSAKRKDWLDLKN